MVVFFGMEHRVEKHIFLRDKREGVRRLGNHTARRWRDAALAGGFIAGCAALSILSSQAKDNREHLKDAWTEKFEADLKNSPCDRNDTACSIAWVEWKLTESGENDIPKGKDLLYGTEGRPWETPRAASSKKSKK